MIFTQLSQQLTSLIDLLVILNNKQYTQEIKHLAGTSVGGHTRHIIELVQCVLNGYNAGEVNYINRRRNLDLQTDKELAVEVLQLLANNIRQEDKRLKVTIEEAEDGEVQEVYTTYYREIIYNAEHTIHHLALIRVALIEMNLNVVDEKFGLAYSTIKFRSSTLTA